jgi:hypothetical protein
VRSLSGTSAATHFDPGLTLIDEPARIDRLAAGAIRGGGVEQRLEVRRNLVGGARFRGGACEGVGLTYQERSNNSRVPRI